MMMELFLTKISLPSQKTEGDTILHTLIRNNDLPEFQIEIEEFSKMEFILQINQGGRCNEIFKIIFLSNF